MKGKYIAVLAAAMAAVMLSGCGGSHKSGKTNNNFDFKPTFETKTEDVQENVYRQTGKFTYDEFGAFTWTQYSYDDQGNRIFERVNEQDNNSYMEITYNEKGDETSIAYYGSEGSLNMLYFYEYEYDDAGNKTVKYEIPNGQTESTSKSEYQYHADGYLEREIVYYDGSSYREEKMYDANGHITTLVSYDGEIEQGYESNEYDAYGNITGKTMSNAMVGTIVFTYTNEYDADGNLIASTMYYPDGSVVMSNEYIYADPEGKNMIYTYDQLVTQLEEMKGIEKEPVSESKETNKDASVMPVIASDAVSDQIINKIYNGETVFTFGYKSADFMQLKDVNVVEAGQDADGNYLELRLYYDSEYGEFAYIGRAYYVDNGGMIELTKCVDNLGAASTNPTVDFEALTKDYIDMYLFAEGYRRVARDSSGVIFEAGNDYRFTDDYQGTFAKYHNGILEYEGRYTTAPSDKVMDYHTYDFTLTLCTDGLCHTYYCRTLKERTIIYMCTEYDEANDLVVSGDIWVAEGDANEKTRELLMNAE